MATIRDTILKASSCTKCDRIVLPQLCLRNCAHSLCMSCAIVILRDMKSSRIKCPAKECTAFLHPDDVRSILVNPALFPLRDSNENAAYAKLMVKYEGLVVLEALGGSDRTEKCPECKAVYMGKTGCHMVQCSDPKCLTYFCWHCGEKTKSFGHHSLCGKKKCRLTFQDSTQGFLPIRYLHEHNACCLWLYFLLLYYPLLFIGPPYIAYRTVRYAFGSAWSWSREQPAAVQILTGIPIILLAVLVFLIVALLSMPYLVYLWFMCVIMFNPCCASSGTINIGISCVKKLFDVMGYTSDSVLEAAEDHALASIEKENNKRHGWGKRGPNAFMICDEEFDRTQGGSDESADSSEDSDND